MLRFNQSNVATKGLLLIMEEVDITAMHRITKRGDIIQTLYINLAEVVSSDHVHV